MYLAPVRMFDYEISNLQQIRDMLNRVFEKFCRMHDLCFTLIKIGNANTPNINDFLPSTIFCKICFEKLYGYRNMENFLVG